MTMPFYSISHRTIFACFVLLVESVSCQTVTNTFDNHCNDSSTGGIHNESTSEVLCDKTRTNATIGPIDSIKSDGISTESIDSIGTHEIAEIQNGLPNNEYLWLKSTPQDDYYSAYSSVIESVEKLYTSAQLRYHSCKGKCGSYGGSKCSCSALCYHYKTCCYDYAKECGGTGTENDNPTFVSEHLQNAWIKEVSLKCSNNILLVSSCRPSAPNFEKQSLKMKETIIRGPTTPETSSSGMLSDWSSRQNLQSTSIPFSYQFTSRQPLGKKSGKRLHQPIESSNNISKSDLLNAYRSELENDNYDTDTNNVNEISIKEYLMLISQEVSGGRLSKDSLTEFETALLSWPIRDSSSGIIYENKTIYDCNQAEDRSMTLMNLGIHVSPADVLNGQTLVSVDILFKHAIPNSLYFQRPSADVSGLIPFEPCVPVMISECMMDSYDNILIREACDRVSMPINVTYSLNDTFKETKTYKNIFCFVCSRKIVRFSRFDTVNNLIPRKFPHIFFKVNDGNMTLFSQSSILAWPTWIQIECHFYVTQSLLTDPFMGMNTTRGSTNVDSDKNGFKSDSKADTDNHHSNMDVALFTNVCKETHCRRGLLTQPPCYEDRYLFLLLPNVEHKTFSPSQLEAIAQLLMDALNQTIENQITPPSINEAVEVAVTKNGMPFAYEVSIFYRLSHVDTQLDMKALISQALIDIQYPFKRGHYHFCYIWQRTNLMARIYICNRMNDTDFQWISTQQHSTEPTTVDNNANRVNEKREDLLNGSRKNKIQLLLPLTCIFVTFLSFCLLVFGF